MPPVLVHPQRDCARISLDQEEKSQEEKSGVRSHGAVAQRVATAHTGASRRDRRVEAGATNWGVSGAEKAPQGVWLTRMTLRKRAVCGQYPGVPCWKRTTWSVELVCSEVLRQLGVKVSRPHMGRLLREAGCRRCARSRS